MSKEKPFSFDNAVAVITGAGQGIGSAIAKALAKQGMSVVLASRNEATLSAIAAEIQESGHQAAYIVTDVTKPDNMTATVQFALKKFGRLDVLVNNAGVAFNAPLQAGEIAEWDTMIDVNLRGVLYGLHAVLPHFIKQGSGHIVTIGSTSAYKWVPGQGVYAATKAAVRALSEVMRQELTEHMVRTTLISPGFTNTEFILSTKNADELESLKKRRDAMAMPPEAVAQAVVYALSQPHEVNVGEILVRSTVQP